MLSPEQPPILFGRIAVITHVSVSSGNLFPQSSNEWIKSYGSGADSYDEGIDIVTDIYGNIYAKALEKFNT